jgi:DNA (cytosine-5)-methyltransferase 1
LTDAVSKTQAYKQFGNSVCVKVVEAVAEQMISTFHKAEAIQKQTDLLAVV